MSQRKTYKFLMRIYVGCGYAEFAYHTHDINLSVRSATHQKAHSSVLRLAERLYSFADEWEIVKEIS